MFLPHQSSSQTILQAARNAELIALLSLTDTARALFCLKSSEHYQHSAKGVCITGINFDPFIQLRTNTVSCTIMDDASLDLMMSSGRLHLDSSYRKLINERLLESTREIKFRRVKHGLNLTPILSSLSICSTLWDNYAYFLGNLKVSGHTSKPFKCKSTDTYIIPGENRTISSSFRATTGQ